MIAIIDYNAGNITSVQNTLTKLGYESIITKSKEEIIKADKVILPGVGEAKKAMNFLYESNLVHLIPNLTQPVLGICLGLQLMCRYSEEGNTKCLGIFNVDVKLFPYKDIVPHMGWNNFNNLKSQFCDNVNFNDDVYYIHSYYVGINKHTIASCIYMLEFSSILQKNNFYAMQFHPEKSGEVGAKILKKFLTL